MNEEIEVTVKIPYPRIADLLCGAFEGGSNYWYEIVKYVKPDKIWVSKEYPADDRLCHRHLQYPLSEGGAVIISAQTYEKDPKGYRLDLDAIHRGIQTMMNKYPMHFAAVVAETDDAETSDVFLQCCLFGEIVYG